jgi:short-subunit dehydrogenase
VQLSGSTVLLTGASGGLGQAIARELHARGARLLLSGRRGRELDALAAELDGPRTLIADLSDVDAVGNLGEQAVGADVLVANAGIPAAGVLESFTTEEIDRTLDINLRSAVVLTRALLPGMLERRSGHLVFISSIAGKTTVPGNPLYHATKYGLRGFAGGLRADLHASGVGVSCVFPGFIREAGIYAESGVKLPPGVGTRSPRDVGRAVARAIEDDLAEIDVASPAQRIGVLASAVAPGMTSRALRRLGSPAIARQMGEALRGKR